MDIQWDSMEGFRNSKKQTWYSKIYVENYPIGTYKNFGNLGFALVNKAGHMVIYDQP